MIPPNVYETLQEDDGEFMSPSKMPLNNLPDDIKACPVSPAELLLLDCFCVKPSAYIEGGRETVF